MKTMSVAQFKARCLKIIDRVRLTREPIVITKNGQPLAKLVPSDDPARGIFNRMKGEVEIIGQIVSPAIPLEDWDMFR